MKEVLFITAEDVRDRTNLDSNIDDSKINNTMVLAQDMILEPILGTLMFDEIKTQVIETGTLDDKYKTLIDEYARKVLLAAIQHKIVSVLIYRFNNTGTSKADIDKEQILSVKEIKELREEMKEYIGTYGHRLTRFLKANSDTYPLYDDVTDEGVNSVDGESGLGFYAGDTVIEIERRKPFGI